MDTVAGSMNDGGFALDLFDDYQEYLERSQLSGTAVIRDLWRMFTVTFYNNANNNNVIYVEPVC